MSFADSVQTKHPRTIPSKHVIVYTEDEKSSKTYLAELVAAGHQTVDLKVVGRGKHTVELVEEAIKTLPEYEKKLTQRIARVTKVYRTSQKKLRFRYDEVWTVFDKDDFSDFDKAVKMSNQQGYLPGWSNPCFELWYYLYTQTVDKRRFIHRDAVFDFLTNHYKTQQQYGKHYRKLKGDAGQSLHRQMTQDAVGIGCALARAKKLSADKYFIGKVPSQKNPYTLFHELVESLTRP